MPTIKESIDPAAAKAVDQAERDFEKRKAQAEMLGKGLGPEWTVPPALAGAGDAISTYIAMKRGAKEANPLYKVAGGNPEATAALAALLTAGQVMAIDRLAKKGNRRGAKVASALKTATSGYLTAKNISNAKKLGSR